MKLKGFSLVFTIALILKVIFGVIIARWFAATRTALKQPGAPIKKSASNDPLTGLTNR